MTVFAAGASLLAGVFCSFLAQAEALDPSAFAYRATVTFSGYTGTSTLTNFPALVRLSRATVPGYDGSQAAADGSDIRFALGDGTLLTHEIDTWNASGESAIWVRVPELTGTTTAVTMYWGAATPASLPAVDATAVWTNYVGVWHFSETTGNAADSSLADDTLDAMPHGNPETAGAMSGAVGNGRICAAASGQVNHGFTVASSAALRTLGTNFTFTGWCRNGGAVCNNAWMIVRGDAGAKVYGWALRRRGNGDHDYSIYDRNWSFRSKYPLGACGYGGWDMMAVVFDGPSYVSYDNGVNPIASAATSDPFPGAENDIDAALAFSGAIKNGAIDGTAWWGGIDEYRLYKGTRSADFLRAEYLTAAKNASFTTYSAASAVAEGTTPDVVFDDPVSPNGFKSRFTGVVTTVGSGAETVDVYLSLAPQGETLPAATAVVTGLAAGADFSYSADDLQPGTVYAYQIHARNNLGEVTATVAGSVSLSAEGLVAKGGSMSIDGNDRIHTFTTNGTLTVVSGGTAEVLLVGGGGGGGAGRGGGGGGGGVVYRESLTLAPGEYAITVGMGGTGAKRNGENTATVSATVGGDTTAFGLTAFGGGYGGSGGQAGNGASSGGNGGLYYNSGGSRSMAGGSVDGQGNRGGNAGSYEGGGGGGAGEPGEGSLTGESRRGGAGRLFTISGRPFYYGGGGNGCRSSAWKQGSGGRGLFASQSEWWSVTGSGGYGEDGLDGFGMGGGGGGYQNVPANTPGGRGGSGTVIVRYRAAGDVPYRANILQTTGGEVVVYKENGKRYAAHVFRADGTFMLPSRARVQLLAVGGGGGGGSPGTPGGGGGGGGVLVVSNLVLEAGTYPIIIGAGGKATSNSVDRIYYNGGMTRALGYLIPGGGTAGSSGAEVGVGASGSGGFGRNNGSGTRDGGLAYSGWGCSGGYGVDSGSGGRGGGGGGAGQCGFDGAGNDDNTARGGDGVRCDFIGQEAWYGGGGGGAIGWYRCSYGGKGGGGRGPFHTGGASDRGPSPGEPNTGGGGGGGVNGITGVSTCGADGGSGIVIIRYELTPNGMTMIFK